MNFTKFGKFQLFRTMKNQKEREKSAFAKENLRIQSQMDIKPPNSTVQLICICMVHQLSTVRLPVCDKNQKLIFTVRLCDCHHRTLYRLSIDIPRNEQAESPTCVNNFQCHCYTYREMWFFYTPLYGRNMRAFLILE